jgi:hypothetical protein
MTMTTPATKTETTSRMAYSVTCDIHAASFKLDDGVSFVHVASIETPDGSNPLTALPTFQELVARIKDRCEEPPITAEMRDVGAYRLLG